MTRSCTELALGCTFSEELVGALSEVVSAFSLLYFSS